jgi:hypothetical protein
MLWQLPAWAGAPKLSVQINRPEVEVGESFRLTLVAKGFDSELGDPKLPPGMQIEGRSAQTSMSMVFGKGAEKETRIIYSVLAQKVGKFVLGPYAVKSSGTIIRSNMVEVTVVAAGAQSQGEGRGGKGQGSSGVAKPGAFLVAEVTKPNPFVHEPVELTLKLHYRLPISNAQIQQMDLGAFDVYEGKELEQREYETSVEGIDYRVIEIRRRVAPRKSGSVTVPPVRIDVDVRLPQDKRTGDPFQDFFSDDGFFDSPFFSRTERKAIVSKPVVLTVRELPEPKPAGWSGVVGDVTVSGSLSKPSVAVGENATLTIKIEGRADLAGVALPTPAVGDELKIYPDKPVLERDVDVQGNLVERKVFSYGLVPVKPGTIALPFKEIVVFSPEKGLYETKPLGVSALQVTGTATDSGQPASAAPTGASMASPRPNQRQVAEQGSDILPPREDLAELARDRRVGVREVVRWLLIPSLLLSLLLGLRLWERWREQATSLDPERARRRAYSLWQRELVALAKGSYPGATEKFEALLRAIRVYVGHKSGILSAAATAEEMREMARSHGVTPEATEQLFEITTKAELCGIVSGAAEREDFKRMVDVARTVVARVEKEWV